MTPEQRRTATPAGVPLIPARVLAHELQRIWDELQHHCEASTDPCQDRGVEWPCDVAEALFPELKQL